MRALKCLEYGPPERLKFADVAAPSPAADEAVVAVRCCAISFFDTLFIRGFYQIKPPLPFIPGAEIAGVIAEVGASIGARFSPGDRVVALTWTGGLAERVCVAADALVRLPDAVGFAAGAAMVMAYGTAALALDEAARLQAGETVLVLGGGGGVGAAAIDIAKARGAVVIAAASGSEKLALCRELGADHLVDYGRDDLKTAIRDRFGAIDVIFDPLGGAFTEAAFRCIAKGGRHLIIGFAAGDIPRVPMNLPLAQTGEPGWRRLGRLLPPRPCGERRSEHPTDGRGRGRAPQSPPWPHLFVRRRGPDLPRYHRPQRCRP